MWRELTRVSPTSEPEPTSTLNTPGRNPRLGVDLREERGRRRGERRRLEHHRVSRDQRRRRLPDRDRPGKVPGRDQGDHPDRLADGIGERAARFRRKRLASHPEAGPGVVLDERDALHHLAPGFLQDLSLFPGHEARDLVHAGARDVGGAPENSPALWTRHFPPLLEGLPRRLDGALGVFRRRHRKLGDDVARVGGVDVLHYACGGGLDPFSVDERAGSHR